MMNVLSDLTSRTANVNIVMKSVYNVMKLDTFVPNVEMDYS